MVAGPHCCVQAKGLTLNPLKYWQWSTAGMHKSSFPSKCNAAKYCNWQHNARRHARSAGMGPASWPFVQVGAHNEHLQPHHQLVLEPTINNDRHRLSSRLVCKAKAKHELQIASSSKAKPDKGANSDASGEGSKRPLRLILLRHAKSSWDDPRLEDHERPLNKRGRKAAPDVAAQLRLRGEEPHEQPDCSGSSICLLSLSALLHYQ